MGSPINIPEWQPIQTDFASIPQLFIAAAKARAQEDSLRQNAETQRQYAANQDRKISADMARQAWQAQRTYSNDQYKRDTDAATMAQPNSPVMQAGRVSPEQGNMAGKPYGITFEKKTSQEWPQYQDTVPSADAAAFLQGGGVPKAQGAEDPLLAFDPTKHPLATQHQPLQGPTPGGDPLADQPDAQAPLTAEPDIDAATAERAPPVTTHLYSNFRGTRAEVKPQETAIFPEAEYNAMFDKLLGQGIKSDVAARLVEGQRRTDIGENGRQTRFDAGLDQKQATQLTREETLGDHAANREQSGANAQTAAQARLGAASIMGGSRGGSLPGIGKEQAAAANALNQRITQIRNVTAWSKLVESEKTSDILLHDVETGAVPLQNREAQVLAAKIIRGRVTNEEMHQLYDNLGGAADFFNRLVSNTGMGELSPIQKDQLRKSVDVLLNQHKVMVQRAGQVARKGLNTFRKIMPDDAQDAEDMLLMELGIQPGSIQDDAPAAAPGVPRSPGAPRPAAPRAPGSPAAPPPTAQLSDEQAVNMARERLARDPNDAKARAVLKLHGMDR